MPKHLSIALAGIGALLLLAGCTSAPATSSAGDAPEYTAATVSNANGGDDATELVRLDTPAAVYEEHIRALNACDWDAIMVQYPDQAEILFPHAVTVVGREEIADLFAGFVNGPEDGGLCGITFTEEHRQTTGGTLSVQWVAEADFLAEPYRGSDAYISDDGLMVSMVSTFDGDELVFKE